MSEFGAYAASDPRPVLLLNTNGLVIDFNPPALRIVKGLVKGSDFTRTCAEEPRAVLEYLKSCGSTRGPVPAALTFYDEMGTTAWRCDGGVVIPARNSPAVIVLRLRERADAHGGFVALKDKIEHLNREVHHRKRLQVSLEEALRMKELLLAEVNHRVKNNLQVISSMLSMAIHGNAQDALKRTSERILAISRVHQLLYENGNAEHVDCPLLIKTLASGLEAIHKRADIKINLDCSDLRLDPDRAIALALLVNELLSNAFKHAFPDGNGGTIRVRLSKDGNDKAVLTVLDDGAPFPASPRSGAGLKIVKALAGKLGGELQMVTEPAKAFGIAFTT